MGRCVARHCAVGAAGGRIHGMHNVEERRSHRVQSYSFSAQKQALYTENDALFKVLEGCAAFVPF